MSIIDPLALHVSSFGGSESPGSGEAVGVGVVGVVVGVGVGVGVGVRVLVGVGLGVGCLVGVADLLTVADGEGTGRVDLTVTTGGRRVSGLFLGGF